MIQRIQTIYMLLAAIVAGLLFVFPMAKVLEMVPGMLADGKLESQDSSVLMGINAAIAALALISIFLFKNRNLQLRTNALNMLLLVALPLVAFFLVRKELQLIPELIVQAGAFLPAVSILFLIAANRHIRKDQALVASADRLR